MPSMELFSLFFREITASQSQTIRLYTPFFREYMGSVKTRNKTSKKITNLSRCSFFFSFPYLSFWLLLGVIRIYLLQGNKVGWLWASAQVMSWSAFLGCLSMIFQMPCAASKMSLQSSRWFQLIAFTRIPIEDIWNFTVRRAKTRINWN